jgi:hypothetical protein
MVLYLALILILILIILFFILSRTYPFEYPNIINYKKEIVGGMSRMNKSHSPHITKTKTNNQQHNQQHIQTNKPRVIPQYPSFVLDGDTGLRYDKFVELLATYKPDGINPFQQIIISSSNDRQNKEKFLLEHKHELGNLAADFALTDMHAIANDSNIYNMGCYNTIAIIMKIVNFKQLSRLTNKHRLYEEHPTIRRFMMHSREISIVDEKTELIYPVILKPTGAGLGRGVGIAIAESYVDIEKFRNENIAELQKRNQGIKSDKYKKFDVVVCDYIKHPLLFGDPIKGTNNLKFHFRIYMLVISPIKKLSGEIIIPTQYKINRKFMRIMTAAEPFKLGDYYNKRIHDTHLKSTSDNYFYPDTPVEGLDVENFNKQIDELEKAFETDGKLYNDIECYDNQYVGYTICGLDVMVCNDGNANNGKDENDASILNQRIALLECNDQIGTGTVANGNQQVYEKFADDYMQWQFDEVVKPTFDILRENGISRGDIFERLMK